MVYPSAQLALEGESILAETKVNRQQIGHVGMHLADVTSLFPVLVKLENTHRIINIERIEQTTDRPDVVGKQFTGMKLWNKQQIDGGVRSPRAFLAQKGLF